MISEELLAAFEEGKTNARETAMVLKALSTNVCRKSLFCPRSWML